MAPSLEDIVAKYPIEEAPRVAVPSMDDIAAKYPLSESSPSTIPTMDDIAAKYPMQEPTPTRPSGALDQSASALAEHIPAPSVAMTYGTELAHSVLPAGGGIAGAAWAARVHGPWYVKAGAALAAGIGGGVLISKGQELVEDKLLGKQTAEAMKEYRAAGREAHPLAALAAEVTPGLIAFRPSPSDAKKIITLGKAVAKEGWRAAQKHREAAQALLNSTFGAGSAFAIEGGNQIREGKFDLVRLAGATAAGVAGTKQTVVGKMITPAARGSAGKKLPDEVEQGLEATQREIQREQQALAEGFSPEAARGAAMGARKGAEIPHRPETPEVPPRDLILGETVPELGETVPTQLAAKTAGAKTTPAAVKKQLKAEGELEHPTQRMADLEEWATHEVSTNEGRAQERVFSGERSSEVVALGHHLRMAARKRGDYDLESKITDHVSQVAKEMGRGANAVKFWYQGLSDEGFIAGLRKAAARGKIPVTEEQWRGLRDSWNNLKDMSEGANKDTARQTLMRQVADAVPPTAWDKLDAYRYNNALSSPRSTMRNLYQNSLGQLVYRPLTMLKRPWEIPAWYMDNALNLMDGARAFRQSMREGEVGPFMERVGQTDIEKMRRSQMGTWYSWMPQFMNAQDKFYRAMLIPAERNRLIRQGKDPQLSQKLAEEMADNLLVRSPVGRGARDDKLRSVFSQSMDWLASGAEHMTKDGTIGKLASQFMLFIRTPTNVAKRMIETSLLGVDAPFRKATITVDPKWPIERQNAVRHQNEKIAYWRDELIMRQVLGAVASTAGALAAYTGNTAWLPPSDPTEKERWYASGRRPFSVKVGEYWVPFFYFGNMALAIAGPAAAVHYSTQRGAGKKDALAIAEIIGNTSGGMLRYLGSQTSAKGMSDFIGILAGDEDVSAGQAVGFVASQWLPYSGAMRWLNTIYDPYYRRAGGKGQIEKAARTLAKDVPELSKSLETYGKPGAMREWSSIFAPYTVGRNVEGKWK